MASAPVCCLDLDTFFVSVERLLDPRLIGSPVVVGAAPGERGVVTACSYEVRAFGVRSGMPIRDAVRLAPHAVYLPTRHGTYGPYAGRVRAVLERFCPVVRTASIDEFFLDFRGCERLYGRPGEPSPDATLLRVVREMRAAVQAEVGLPASVGIGATRAVAKMASGRAKPAGVLQVCRGEEVAFASVLPVRRFPGIGPVAEARLTAAGVHTLGQLLPHAHAAGWMGEAARTVVVGLTGPVPDLGADRTAFHVLDTPGDAGGSLSHERTFFADVGSVEQVEQALLGLVERVASRARARGVRAATVTLKLRYADFETLTRRRGVPPTHDERTLWPIARSLLQAGWRRQTAVRLIGVALSRLTPPAAQLCLPLPETRPPVGAALDAVRARFGFEAVRMGTAPATGRRRERPAP